MSVDRLIGSPPENWELRKIKTVARVRTSNVDKRTEEGETPVRLCNYTDVYYSETIRDASDFLAASASQKEIRRFRLRKGDVLLTKDSESWDDIAVPAHVARDFDDVLCGYHLALVRPRKEVIDGRFLFYCYMTPLIADQFSLGANGITRFGLSQDVLRSAQIPVPPLPIQRAIASFLDRETEKIDTLIEKKRRFLALLEEKRTALISQAVTRGLDPGVPMKDSGVEWLGEIPEHWEVVQIKHLVTRNGQGLQMGPFGSMLKDLESVETGFRVYGQENTISGNFSRGHRWITEERFRALVKYQVSADDILLTRKGSLGNAQLVSDHISSGIIDSDTIRLRVRSKDIKPGFLALCLHSSSALEGQIRARRRGAVLSGVNSSVVGNLLVSLPPLAEQERILQEVHQRTFELGQLKGTIANAISLLQEYRTAIISAAVTGRIDVRDQVAHE